MRLTPLDIQNHRFNTRFRGFDPAEVEAFVRLIAEDVESLVRERDGLRQEVRRLEARVDELSVNEKTLQETLVTAQALSEDLKKTAVKETEVMLSEAEVKAEKVLAGAQHRVSRLQEDIREMKLLRARLAGAIRSTIETHLELLESLSTDAENGEKPELPEARPPGGPAPRA